MVFPYAEEMVLRTEENYLEHVVEAVRTKEPCYGIKGPTLLFYMVENMLESAAIDSLHCLYLGVTKQIINILFNSVYHKEPWSLSKKLDEVNKLMKSIRLPHFVQRELVPFDKPAFIKGSIARTLLYHVLLPLLKNVLPEVYFVHLQLLVEGAGRLNKDSVSPEDVQISIVLLNKFVADFQMLYGLRHMSYNVHLVRHLPEAVLDTGPLCRTSCFSI